MIIILNSKMITKEGIENGLSHEGGGKSEKDSNDPIGGME